MPFHLPKAESTDLFNHALSHHVAHWAAYIAMMSGLVTIAFAISAAAGVDFTGTRGAGAALSVVAVWLGAMYFINGMDTYGATLRDALSDGYRLRVEHFPHKTTIWAGRFGATMLALLDLVLVWYL